jgi:hypothetical protein
MPQRVTLTSEMSSCAILVGYVYFIRSPINDLVKIGVTTRSPQWRLEKFRIGSPVPLEPIGAIPGGEREERILHQAFAAYRDHGEWFRYRGLLRQCVEEHAWTWPDPRHDREPAEHDRQLWLRATRKCILEIMQWLKSHGLEC